MSSDSRLTTDTSAAPSAFLLQNKNGQWEKPVRLIPGQATQIGRSMSNTIVVQDAMSSRNHCELFVAGGEWFVRDQQSRNGTMVNDRVISSDQVLQHGDVIRIGSTELGFTFNPDSLEDRQKPSSSADTMVGLPDSEDGFPIVERLKKPQRYDSAAADDPNPGHLAESLSKLYRLALQMGAAATVKELADRVLENLCEETRSTIGAILLWPKAMPKEVSLEDDDTESTVRLEKPHDRDLQIISYRGKEEGSFQRVSAQLTRTVIGTHEAVLASDNQNTRVMESDSIHNIKASSVICAPLRVGEQLLGVLHLYSDNLHAQLGYDELEYTLAVADQFSFSLMNLGERDSLATGLAQAKKQNRHLLAQLEQDSQLVGDSIPMSHLKADIEQIAPTEATVLIRGESGVGKELVARSIHFKSRRKSGPFICLNCAALSESLLESELFGHEKGAFTGATERKMGKFEQAHQGTLFLDEVGEMGASLQAKFLRALEGHAFERVGGQKQIQVDTRVVAATNRDLEKAVKDGDFRKDLYFRLQVVEVVVPPLRDRVTDIPMLANYFLERFRMQQNRLIEGFSEDAMDALVQYQWPGNIRELQNTIERTVILCTDAQIQKTDIRLSALSELDTPDSVSPKQGHRPISLEQLEREHILQILEQFSWNKSQAAQVLGIERSTLDRKLKRYNVSRPQN